MVSVCHKPRFTVNPINVLEASEVLGTCGVLPKLWPLSSGGPQGREPAVDRPACMPGTPISSLLVCSSWHRSEEGGLIPLLLRETG